jgi:demethylmenaquinone methyltransferase / 2-methoxy-6-polyprenyl-1,4-benzoquinol methylase
MTPSEPVTGTDKTPARIAGMFDAIAPRYDLLNQVLSAGFDRRWRTCAIRGLGLTGVEHVLDLCTGTADVAIAAATATPAALRVTGVDFSLQMLRLGAQKVDTRGLGGRIRLAQGDAMALPVASASADAATVAFGIRNVQRPEAAFAEVFRVLKPGGRFAILEFGTPRLPVIRQAYLAYFRHVLPRVGSLVSGHASAYAYLPASVGAFPEPASVVASLERVGFSQVRAVPLTLGVVYHYSAHKPAVR